MATSRSLGVLSIDLIAKISGFTEGMNRAEREADRKGRDIARKQRQSAKETEAAWDKASKAIGAAFAAVSVGAVAQQLFGVAKETANLALEFDKLSQLSGTSSQTFQKLAAGAETVGISAEKLADIFKDVQDKAGDFAQTGGGGMADFFENIAPKVGVTIEQFRRLSGPEALQLYVSSLEKANLSQQDMVFYMEALASDSTMLLPLLRENGAEFNRLGDAAERAGAIMGDDALSAAKAYKDASIELENTLKGVRSEIMQQLLPAITQVTAAFADPAVRQAIVEYAGWLGEIASKASQFAQVVSGSSFWGWLQVGAEDAEDTGKAIQEAERKITDLQKTLTSLQRPFSKFFNADDIAIAQGAISTLQAKLQTLYKQQEVANASAQKTLDDLGKQGLPSYESLGGTPAPAALSPAFSKPKTGGKSEAEKAAEDARRYIDALKKQADQVQKMTAYEKLLYDLREGSVKFSTEAQRKEAESLAIRADFSKDGLELEKERQRLQQEGARLTEQTLSPLQQLATEQAKINALYDAGVISLETQLKALDKAEERLVGGDLGKWIRGDVSPLSGGRFDDQEARYEAEKEREEERYAEQLERLTEAMEERGMEQAQFYSEYEQLAKEHASRMAQIEQAKEDIMVNKLANGFGQMYDDLSAFATQFGIKNREMLAVIKAAAVAQTVIQTYKAAQDSYTAMAAIPVVGPALGIAAAAAAVAGGLARVNAIRSQGFAEGGYTGAGGKYEVAGVVHKGEGVLSQRDMAALGGVGAFESFRSSLHSGYAEGGAVGYPAAAAAGYDLNSTAKTESGASKVTVQLIGGEFQGAAIEEDYDAVNEETIIRVVSRDFQRRGPISQAGSQVFGWNRVGT